MKIILKYLFLLVMVMISFGCSGPEAKKMSFFEKGKIYFEQQDYQKARLEFKNAIQIDPKFTEAIFMLGQSELRANDLKPAFANFRKVVEIDSTHLGAQYQLAKLFFAAREVDKAEEKIALILAADPEHKDALIMRGAILQQQGKSDQALLHLRQLLERGIDAPDVYLLLALNHKTAGNHEREGQLLADGLSHNPDNIPLLTALSDFYRQRNKLDKAIELAEKMVRLQPDSPRNYTYLAALYTAADQRQQGGEVLDRLLKLDQGNTDYRLAVTRFYLQQQQLKEAEKTLLDGLNLNPANYPLRKALSDIYLATERREDAIEQLKTAIQTAENNDSPDFYAAKTELAKIYLRSGEIDLARTYSDEVIAKKPENSDAHFVRGQIYLLAGDGQKAIAEFRPVVTESPVFLPGYLALAEAYMRNREPNLALNTLQTAQKIEPENRAVLISMAKIQLLQKKYAEARELLDLVLSRSAEDQEAQVLLGDAAMGAGDFNEAQVLFTRLEKLAPANPVAPAKLGELALRQGQWRPAVKAFTRALALSPDSLELQAALVQAHSRAGEVEKGLKLCEQWLQAAKDPHQQAYYQQLKGDLSLAGRRLEDAEQAYTAAIELYPEWPNPQEAMVRLLLLQKKTAAAEERLNKMIAADPDRISNYLVLGQMYVAKGERARAIDIYEKALKVDPEQWQVANDLAYVLSEGESTAAALERARDLAQKALQQQPEEARILDTLGWVLYRQGQIDQALTYIRQAQGKDPEKSVLNYHLGKVLYDQGRTDQAKEFLQVALSGKEQFSGRDDAQKTLESIQ